MATLFKEVKYNLAGLVQQIEMGVIGLPDIQRPFVWPDKNVRKLFDSMYRGYPVGFFLFWANANVEGTKSIGNESKQKNASLLIVDGQQRLTSLYAVMKGEQVIRENFTTERIVIAFNPIEEKFEVPDAAVRKDPRYFQDITDLWRSNINIFKVINDFISNLKNAIEVTDEMELRIQNSMMQLKNLESYPFSTLELSQNITEEQVAEVFVRINSEGKKLNQGDFILTLMSVFWEDGRKQLEEFCRLSRIPSKGQASPFNYLIDPDPDNMLRVSVAVAFRRARLQYVYSILRGKDLETGVFSVERREQQFKLLEDAQARVLDVQNWHEFIKAVKQAGYAKGDYISSKIALMYSYAFFLIGRIDFGIDLFVLKKLISKWFFMASLTSRYTTGGETRMEIDLALLRDVNSAFEFQELLEKLISTELTNDFWETTLPQRLATSSSTSPTLYAYYASLYALDAYGLFSKLKVSDLLQEGLRSKKSPLERHHLFPKAWLKRNGFPDDKETNQIANFALVEWNDNIKISDKHPSEYLPLYDSRLNDEQRRNMSYWHALPVNWFEMQYTDFLRERRKLMAKVVKDAYEKVSS